MKIGDWVVAKIVNTGNELLGTFRGWKGNNPDYLFVDFGTMDTGLPNLHTGGTGIVDEVGCPQPSIPEPTGRNFSSKNVRLFKIQQGDHFEWEQMQYRAESIRPDRLNITTVASGYEGCFRLDHIEGAKIINHTRKKFLQEEYDISKDDYKQDTTAHVVWSGRNKDMGYSEMKDHILGSLADERVRPLYPNPIRHSKPYMSPTEWEMSAETERMLQMGAIHNPAGWGKVLRDKYTIEESAQEEHFDFSKVKSVRSDLLRVIQRSSEG